MKIRNFVAFCSIILVAVSCDYQKQNKKDQKDLRENDKVVYGVHPDSAAAQLKNKYPSKPEVDARAAEIRAKFEKEAR